ncbi:MAG: hypothetical protein HY445_02740 [Candidatus Niyogibacteria bacterium]|nr:hypothetical protein [Candidatus Niyogibacteria bacterium]
MPEIIPAINVETFEDLRKQIRAVEPYTKWVHIDIADGTFTPNTIWHNAEDLKTLKTPLNIEVHLMISNIDTRFTDWLLPNVKRLIIHFEATHDPLFVVQRIKDAQKEAIIAILPETPWQETEPFWGKADGILLLSVSPGRAGQKMNANTIEKLKGLHAVCPHCILEIDGGVSVDNARRLVDAGVNRLAAASAIFGQKDIKKAIDEFKKLLSH